MERRTMALLRSGALPIAIEIGRYSRLPTPVDDRLCDLCDMGVVENEKYFLVDCPLYSDLRYDLYYECSKYIDNLTLQNSFWRDFHIIYIIYCFKYWKYLRFLYYFYLQACFKYDLKFKICGFYKYDLKFKIFIFVRVFPVFILKYIIFDLFSIYSPV